MLIILTTPPLSYATTQLYLDTISPSSPTGLTTTPAAWTDVNNFDLSWTNPLDDSGIVGAYYKLYSSPNNDTDGVYVSGANIESIMGISVSLDGVHTVYIWLNDSVGNIDHTNIAITQLKLDTSDPILILNTPKNNTSWDNCPSINITYYDPNFASLTHVVNEFSPIWYENNTEVPLLSGVDWISLPQGEFFVEIIAFDSFGHKSEFTLTLYKDTLAPFITINSLINNTYWNFAPSLNITAIDPNLDTIWYSFKTDNFTLQNNEPQPLNDTIWGNLPEEGKFEVQIYANDTFGHLNYTYMLTLYKDVVAPTIIINSPLNNTYHKVAPIINVTVLDPYFHSLWYRVGPQNILLENNTIPQLTISIWDNLIPDEGGFIIYFYANDSAGNLNDLFKLDLNKDIKDPVVSIDSPNGNLFGDPSPEFKISINELNLNQTWYMLYNLTWSSLNYTFNGLTGKINQSANWKN